MDVFGYFLFAYFRIANKLPWNPVVFGRDRRTLDFNRMSDFSVGQRVEYYSRTLRRLEARQVGNMTAKGDHSTSTSSIEASTCKVGSFISEALPFPNGLNAKSRWSAAWGVELKTIGRNCDPRFGTLTLRSGRMANSSWSTLMALVYSRWGQSKHCNMVCNMV